MLNRAILIGRLTKDPELRHTQNGVAVAGFTLAVDRRFKNANGQKETDFINIVAWRGLGENCAKYLAKGKLAAIEGRLQIRNYEDKDGNKRIAAEVVADDVRFLSPATKKTEEGSYPSNNDFDEPWEGTQGDPSQAPDGVIDDSKDDLLSEQGDLPF
ncbi:MAG: single-stranded DNA-binding protein [Bacillota bacterium]|jgi:single-strand DNA-binding protein